MLKISKTGKRKCVTIHSTGIKSNEGKPMKAKEILSNLKRGIYDSIILELCCEKDRLEREKERLESLINEFESIKKEQDLFCLSAPGRSEIIGNHTDHQLGKVITAGINRDALAIVSCNDERMIRIHSKGFGEFSISIDDLVVKKIQSTESLIQGIVAEFIKRGYQVAGFDALIDSQVPIGSGCSSSACFEVLIATILSELFNEGKVSAIEIAQISQIAENDYFKKPSGLMDQLACSLGGLAALDFKDKKDPRVDLLPSGFISESYSLVLVDTKASHQDLTDEYSSIVAEISEVCCFFKEDVLRQVDEKAFYDAIGQLRKETSDRAVLRAFHVFNEIQRVEQCKRALVDQDVQKFLTLLKESGHSSFEYLQNVYSGKNTKEQACALALAVTSHLLGKEGSYRIHGGGFAGTIQAFVPNEKLEEFIAGIEKVFGKDCAMVCKIRPKGGIRII